MFHGSRREAQAAQPRALSTRSAFDCFFVLFRTLDPRWLAQVDRGRRLRRVAGSSRSRSPSTARKSRHRSAPSNGSSPRAARLPPSRPNRPQCHRSLSYRITDPPSRHRLSARRPSLAARPSALDTASSRSLKRARRRPAQSRATPRFQTGGAMSARSASLESRPQCASASRTRRREISSSQVALVPSRVTTAMGLTLAAREGGRARGGPPRANRSAPLSPIFRPFRAFPLAGRSWPTTRGLSGP